MKHIFHFDLTFAIGIFGCFLSLFPSKTIRCKILVSKICHIEIKDGIEMEEAGRELAVLWLQIEMNDMFIPALFIHVFSTMLNCMNAESETCENEPDEFFWYWILSCVFPVE
jgi:formate hydrogenlyase subunit 4